MKNKDFLISVLITTVFSLQAVSQTPKKHIESTDGRKNPKHEKALPDNNTNLVVNNDETIHKYQNLASLQQELEISYKSSEKYNPELDTVTKKSVLAVAWCDGNYDRITHITRGEKISLAVLTAGYEIGDTISITIGDIEEESTSLFKEETCYEVTFIGTVNYQNFAYLQNVFYVEGEEEYMIILPEWKNRYRCGK